MGAEDLEPKAAAGARLQDAKKASADPVVARMVRNVNIVRMVIYVSGAVLAYLFLFVLL